MENISKIIVKECQTRHEAGGDQIRTILTIDFSDCPWEDILWKAAKPEVINWQNSTRKKNDIPAKATIKVARTGQRAARVLTDREKLVEMFGQQGAEKLIAKHGTPEEAIEAVKALI